MEEVNAVVSNATSDSGLNSVLTDLGISELDSGDQVSEAAPVEGVGEETQSAASEESADETVEENLSPEEIVKKLSEEEEASEQDQSEAKEEESKDNDVINDPDSIHFEIMHNGEMKRLSREEGIELMQKGFDYTQKTQLLSQEKKELEDSYNSKLGELEKSYQEHNELIENYTRLDYTLQLMKAQNPDLFDDLSNYYDQVQAQYDNPVVRNQIQRLETELKTVKTKEEERENEMIRQSFARELTDLQKEVSNSLEKVGIIADWDKVRDAWVDGNKSVKEAFYQVYGDTLTKAYASKAKVNIVKNKARAASKVPTAGQLGRSQPKTGERAVDYRNTGWNQIAELAASGALD